MRRATAWRAGIGATLAVLLATATGPSAWALPTAPADARTSTVEGCLIPNPLGPLVGLDDCAVAMPGSTPSPDPSVAPTPTATDTAPEPAPTGTPDTPGDGDGGGEASTPPTGESQTQPEPQPLAPLDERAPVFTGDPATLSGDGLRIEGLRGIAVVSVRLVDGSTERAIRLSADRIVVDGFRLDVPSGDGGLRNTATTLTVDGNVTVYTPSIRGILADGTERLIDTLTTPTADELAALTRLTLPLRGMVADSIAYDDSHQATF